MIERDLSKRKDEKIQCEEEGEKAKGLYTVDLGITVRCLYRTGYKQILQMFFDQVKIKFSSNNTSLLDVLSMQCYVSFLCNHKCYTNLCM